jgi:hypothetical protein
MQTFEVGHGYRVRTHQAVLAMAFERLMPEIKGLTDLPDELRRVGRSMGALLDGTWDPALDEMDLEEQARIAVPLMNAMRLLAEPHGDGPPPEVRARSEVACALMLRMDPAVAWVAIRNSMAWESTNRPSQGGESYDWMRLWMPHMKAVPSWMDVFVRIRREVM